MDEHGTAARRRLLKGGKISFGGGAVIDCTIRNFSETGAALEVGSPVGIPERFTLVVDADPSAVPRRLAQGDADRGSFRSLTGDAASRADRSPRVRPHVTWPNPPRNDRSFNRERQCLDSRLTTTPVGSGSCGDSFVSVSSLQ